MQYLLERISFLRGMADSLGIDNSTKEGKLLCAIIEVLGEMADAISYLEDENFNLYTEFSEGSGSAYICPNCNDSIEIDEKDLDEKKRIICPKCNNTIIILAEEI